MQQQQQQQQQQHYMNTSMSYSKNSLLNIIWTASRRYR